MRATLTINLRVPDYGPSFVPLHEVEAVAVTAVSGALKDTPITITGHVIQKEN